MPQPQDDQPASPAELHALLRRIRPLHRTLMRVLEHQLAGTELTRPMRALLEQLHDQGPQTVPQLARGLAVRRQFTQRVVNDLVRAGLAERRANVAHKRSWLIAPTPAGARVFADIRAREWEQIARIADNLDREQLRASLALLDYLAEQAGALVPDDGDD